MDRKEGRKEGRRKKRSVGGKKEGMKKKTAEVIFPMMMTVLYFGTTGCLHPKPHRAYQPLVFCLVLASKIPRTEGPGSP